MPVEGVRGLLQDLFPVLRPIPYVRSNERAEAIFCLGCAGRADLYQFYWECEAVSRPWFLTSFAMRRRTIQTIVAACHPADVSEYLVSAIRDETTDRRLNRRRHNNALGCLLAGARYAPDIPDDLRELLLFWLGATNLHIAAAAWIALREHGYAVDIEGRKSLQEAIQAENAFVADERHIYGLMRISQRRRLRSDS